jgi:hypothetical protein
MVLDARSYGHSPLWAAACLLWSPTLAPTDARPCGHLLAYYGPRRSLLRTLAPVGSCLLTMVLDARSYARSFLWAPDGPVLLVKCPVLLVKTGSPAPNYASSRTVTSSACAVRAASWARCDGPPLSALALFQLPTEPQSAGLEVLRQSFPSTARKPHGSRLSLSLPARLCCSSLSRQRPASRQVCRLGGAASVDPANGLQTAGSQLCPILPARMLPILSSPQAPASRRGPGAWSCPSSQARRATHCDLLGMQRAGGPRCLHGFLSRSWRGEA